MNVEVTSEGSFKHTESFLRRILRKDYYKNVERFAQEGMDALVSATPRDTGKTADSWSYEILTTKDSTTITWTNDNYIDGYFYGSDGMTPIVILIEYGHATRNGGYVPPNDFINPALRPVIDKATNQVWSEVTKK